MANPERRRDAVNVSSRCVGVRSSNPSLCWLRRDHPEKLQESQVDGNSCGYTFFANTPLARIDFSVATFPVQ